MNYILIAIGTIMFLFLYWLFIHNKKQKLLKEINALVVLTKIKIYEEFEKTIQNNNNKETAFLAGAMTNSLFGEKTDNENAKQFLEEHRAEVDHELSKIKNNKELCKIITQAYKMNIIARTNLRTSTEENVPDPVSLEKLKRLGIWIDGLESPSPKTFILMAQEYYKKV